MKFKVQRAAVIASALVLASGLSSSVVAEPIFFDDFEDRVADQAKIGNNWTWYDQWFDSADCEGEAAGGFGPFDEPVSDYEHDNRNFANVGEGNDSYYRAGLEVPAWEGALSNMLRVYGNQYNTNATCQRTLIFQEMTIAEAGSMLFSFDVAKDRFGAPANGEITGAFVKVLRQSDSSYATILFERVETLLGENMLSDTGYLEFVLGEEHVGELLQFGFYNDVTPSLQQSWGTSAALYDNVTLDLGGIGPGNSGSWYNSGQSGHGFSAEFSVLNGAPYAVIYWYIYDAQGNPIFFIGQGGNIVGNRAEITFYTPIGMVFGEFDPDSIPKPLEVAGTGVFVFSDSNNATFSYEPSAFSVTTWGHSAVTDLPLVKLFGIPGADTVFDLSQ